jgi:hypothetical protein
MCGAVLFIRPTTSATPAPNTHSSAIQKPLTQFSSIFAAPIGLPPKGACGHTIPLLPKAKIVNQRHTNFPIKRIHWKKSSRNCCNNE